MSAPFTILSTDRRFAESPDVGLPACLCSRCGRPIGEAEIPIRAWPESGAYEYRFHPACLGFETFGDVAQDDEPEFPRGDGGAS